MNEFNPVGVWSERYKGATQPASYGDEGSYRLAASILDKGGVIEDWGCGLAYARKFFTRTKYIGIDGSWSRMCDEVDDLEKRDSKPDFILLRHVLEHNIRWANVLRNAVRCAKSQVLVIIFTKFSNPETHYAFDPDGIPCISFSYHDLIEAISPMQPLEFSIGSEVCWLLDKNNPLDK